MHKIFDGMAEVSSAVVIALLSVHLCFGQFGNQPAKPKGPWMDKSLTPDERAGLVLKEMSLDEKIQLVHVPALRGVPHHRRLEMA